MKLNRLCFIISFWLLGQNVCTAQYKLQMEPDAEFLLKYLELLGERNTQAEYFVIIPAEKLVSISPLESVVKWDSFNKNNERWNPKIRFIIAGKDYVSVKKTVEETSLAQSGNIIIDSDNIYSRLPNFTNQVTLYRKKGNDAILLQAENTLGGEIFKTLQNLFFKGN
jgi:hypothetical protein